jgi:hypothetical protein
MMRMMANENMQEFGNLAAVDQETIRSVVLGYADGWLELPTVPKRVPKY